MIPQHNYILPYSAEIDAAISSEYQNGESYISTKRIAFHVLSTPDKYPLLTSRSRKSTKAIIGLYLSKVKKYPLWTCSRNAHCGSVYRVKPCPEN